MSATDGVEAALESIAEVIEEARALACHDNPVYNEALIDLTMTRLRGDVSFLILGDPAPVKVAASAPVKAPTKAPIGGYVGDGSRGQGGTVRHLRNDCARIGYHGYHPATPKEVRTLPLCVVCR